MAALSHVDPGSAALTLSPAPGRQIVTRKQLAHTSLADRQELLKVEKAKEAAPSLVTRRPALLMRKRRKQLLMVVAVALALFPPMWAVYLVAWLIWRSRPPQQSMRKVRKAVRALRKDQKGVALKHLQEAHYLNPSNSDALYWLGLLLSQQDRHEEAAEALSLVAERVPGLPEVEAALVDAYVAMDEPECAVYHAQRHLEAAPYAPESLLQLAKAFEAAGRVDLAIEALQQAPLHKRTLTEDLVHIHYRLGTLYEQQENPTQALHHFKRVYARDLTYRDVRSRVQALEAMQDPGH